MKILHVINNLDAGGAQKLVADLAMLQDDLEDTEVEIATILPEGEALFGKWLASHSSIKIHHLSFRRPFSPASVSKLRNLFRDFDLIHAHLFPSVYLCALANTGISNPMVYTEHSTSNRRRDHKILLPVEKMVYARYDAIACISEATKENLLKWLDNFKISKRTVVIHNGVDNRKYELGTPFPVSEIFGRPGIPILMISRFTLSKDHATVIKAIPLLSDPDAFMVFVGEGETLKDMKKLSEETGVSNKCVFLGSRHDIPSIISSSVIGLQSSRWEGFGLTALEMMAGGLPVVTSDNEGLKDIVNGGAMVFKAGDYVDLATKINNLLSDDEIRKQTIKACKKRAADFDVSKTLNEYNCLYRRLIKK